MPNQTDSFNSTIPDWAGPNAKVIGYSLLDENPPPRPTSRIVYMPKTSNAAITNLTQPAKLPPEPEDTPLTRKFQNCYLSAFVFFAALCIVISIAFLKKTAKQDDPSSE